MAHDLAPEGNLMSIHAVAQPRSRISRRVDQASVVLLRAVMADHWRPDEAARELLRLVQDDRRVLQLLRARVSRKMLERPTRIAERATLTLDHALSTPAEHRAEPFPSQRLGRSA